jgi:hypothetical protein
MQEHDASAATFASAAPANARLAQSTSAALNGPSFWIPGNFGSYLFPFLPSEEPLGLPGEDCHLNDKLHCVM